MTFDLDAVDTELSEDIKWLESPVELQQTKQDSENEQQNSHHHSHDGPEPEI